MEVNINEIKNNIQILEQHVKELKTQGITDSFDLEIKLIELMPEFYDLYPSIVKRFCRPDSDKQDNTYLFKMLGLIEQVKTGEKSLASVEMNLGEELAQKFVYPIVNNLEKENVNNLEKEKKE
jgi:hypothetical protein